MNNLRIKEIDSYKGDSDGFSRLYAAIWEKAVESEYRYQKQRLLLDTSENIFDVLLKYERDDRASLVKISRIVAERYGKSSCKLVDRLEKLIEQQHKALKVAVQNKTYEESLKWPHNKKHSKDPEFEKEYAKIKAAILAEFDKGGR